MWFELSNDVYQYLCSKEDLVQNLCRLCLCENDVTVPLRGAENKASSNEPLLCTMLMSLCDQLDLEDGLPMYICQSCRDEAIKSYKFKVKCEHSNYVLKSFLSGNFTVKDDSSKLELNGNITNLSVQLEEQVSKKEEDLKIEAEYLDDFIDIEDKKVEDRQEKKAEFAEDGALKQIKPKKKRKTKRTNFICHHCSKIFYKLKTLKAHIQQSHGHSDPVNAHPCSYCKETFKSEHDLNVHSALHDKSAVWKCNQCFKEYRTRAMLKRHLRRHMETKAHSCPSCTKSFAELYALKRHLRVHTGEAPMKNYVCHLCDKRFSERSRLAAHEAQHAGARPHECERCHKRFPSRRLLASHLRVHSDRKPYCCDHCGQGFRHESTLSTHRRVHTGEKPYVCASCGKCFIQNSNLTLHMRVHTGEKPYACDQCERKFSSSSTLKAHVRTHTGEKPFACPVCGKRFAQRDLRGHLRLHSGERPFACSVCPKKFPSAPRLKEHCRVHTGEKPFECGSCHSSFTTKRHLVKHVKSHLKDNETKSPNKVLYVQHIQPLQLDKTFLTTDSIVFEDDHDARDGKNDAIKDVALNVEVPLAVAEELVLQEEEEEIKAEIMVVDDNQNNSNICLADEVTFVNNDYVNDINLVVNEGEVSISSSSHMIEGSAVKVYQLDQSMVQIHSTEGQVTISKMTANI